MKTFIKEHSGVVIGSLVVVLLIAVCTVIKPLAADGYRSAADLIHEFIIDKLSSESPEDYGIYLNDDGTANFVVKVNPGNVDETTAYAMVNGNKVMLSTLQKDGDDYIIPLQNIMPKKLNDQMTVTVYDGDGTPKETISTTFADKLYEIIDTTSSKALKDFCKAFLNYGAYSQIQWNYNTGNLANNGLSESEKNVSDITYDMVENHRATLSGSTEGIAPYGMDLKITNSGIKGRAYYVLSNGYSISEYTFTIDGKEVTPTLYGGKYYQVCLERNNAPDLDKLVTIEVKRNGEGTSTMHISCFTYAEITLRENDTSESGIKLSNFVRSMVKYNNAAKNLNNTLLAG